MGDNFCIAPFIHLNNTPRGKIMPCCVWGGNSVGNMEEGILSAWNGQKMKSLRNQFLRNIRPKECYQCWDVEDAGSNQSFRIRSNTDFKNYMNLLAFQNNKTHLKTPVWLQLKLGAKCTFACRTCGAGSSNKLLKEDGYRAIEDNAILPEHQQDFLKKYAKAEQKKSSFIYENKFWQELKDITPNLRFITFTGGEPLTISEHYEYLEWCVENDYAKNITLDYITTVSYTHLRAHET